ncbi:hypothetical protein L207DRAFT_640593 [Hyaloscypha variabilis F]|uniref:Uncharacterized protein n=1 Tax=Hyaloscypha variabilis (strain UAMH 11265 / GT02V1 / F) TaxID=1149755 RepID=A0A2J6QZS1_HYAVF|nr:hypothetical protein L207DRAFT_640593 [Hyaloscypha variabilis F]
MPQLSMHQTFRWLAASLATVCLWWNMLHLNLMIHQHSNQRSISQSLTHGLNIFSRSTDSASLSSVTGVLIGTVLGMAALVILIFCYGRYWYYSRKRGNRASVLTYGKRRLDRSWTKERNYDILFGGGNKKFRKKRRRSRRVTSSPTIAAPPPLPGPPPPPPADELPPSPQPPIPTTIFNPGQFWNPTELERDMASRALPLDLPNLNSSVSALPGLYGNLGISQSENVLRDTGQGDTIQLASTAQASTFPAQSDNWSLHCNR